MRRIVLALFAVMALLLTFVAPVAADTGPSGPFRESGTSKYLSSQSLDCTPSHARTTCTETGVDVFSVSPTEVVVCVSTVTYTYSDRTGRGRLISQENGCSDPVAASTLNITLSKDNVLTATLASTSVTLYECNRRSCTASRTVTVSASDSGGPAGTFTNRGSFKDGTCTYRYSESGYTADVSGTLTIDGTTLAEGGWAQQSEFKVSSTCR
ncbi:MAG: hypothetical protein H0V73_02280 [Chloroflexi bacterium]|nr:hypothetical protein [Chloroflexota bacterium]